MTLALSIAAQRPMVPNTLQATSRRNSPNFSPLLAKLLSLLASMLQGFSADLGRHNLGAFDSSLNSAAGSLAQGGGTDVQVGSHLPGSGDAEAACGLQGQVVVVAGTGLVGAGHDAERALLAPWFSPGVAHNPACQHLIQNLFPTTLPPEEVLCLSHPLRAFKDARQPDMSKVQHFFS